MRVRRTPQELVTFRKVVADYTSEGYPQWYAEQVAYDILFIERKIRGVKPRRKVAA